MSVPDENLTKCTLLVYRSPQALLHNGLPFSLHSSDKACKRERERVDMILKVQSVTKHIFLWKENKISLVYIKLFVV